MKEKSFSDLPPGDEHLRETQFTSEDVYQGIFLHLKKRRRPSPRWTKGYS